MSEFYLRLRRRDTRLLGDPGQPAPFGVRDLESPDWHAILDVNWPYMDGTFEPAEPREDVAALLEQVAVPGKCRLVVRGSDYFGNGADWTSDVMESPTWAEVREQAIKSTYVTDDQHHVFMEYLRFIGMEPGGVAVYEVLLGS